MSDLAPECAHKGNRHPGPRIPLRYGSAATVICQACGAWRQDRPGFSDKDFQLSPTLTEALKEDDEL